MAKQSSIERAAAQFRAQIIKGEQEAVSPLIEAYSRLCAQTYDELKRVLAEIAREVEQGKEPGVARLYERDRLNRIVTQVGSELQKIAAVAADTLTARQMALIELAGQHAQKLAAMGEGQSLDKMPEGFKRAAWAQVPAGELEHLAGIAGDGSPLKEFFNQLAPNGAAKVRGAIVQGVALGRDEKVIAGDIQKALGGNMGRALGIVRTEGMRAYRESQRQAMRQNTGDDGPIKAMRWFASLSSDTCPACIALHGREFPVDYVMESHPNCRCVLVPVTKSFAELGFAGADLLGGDNPNDFEGGEAWFERQPASKKKQILGSQAYDAYRRGAVKLADFVGHKHDDQWGGMYHALPLKQALANNKRPLGHDLRPHQRETFEHLTQNLGGPEDDAYREGLEAALRYIPSAATARIRQNVTNVEFYATTDDLDARIGNSSEGLMGYESAYDYATGEMFLSGKYESLDYRRELYAHELAHGISGFQRAISSENEWRTIWHKEIKSGQLSENATQDQHEGFSDFGAELYSSKDKEPLKKDFPLAWGFWQKRGFIDGF